MNNNQDQEFEIDSTVVANENGEVVDDEDAVCEITDLLDDVGIADQEGGLVDYKGSMVRCEVATVMESVVDKMQHHLGCIDFPALTFQLGTLKHLAYDKNYKSPNEETADCWWSPVNIKYISLNGSTSEVVGIDGVYINLTAHTKKGDIPMKGYGTSWVNVYLPSRTMGSIRENFKQCT